MTKDEMKAENLTKFQLGDVLYYSWGFDQTQVEFFQITKRTGATIEARPIESEITKDDGLAMTGKATPTKGKFIGSRTITKRIGAFGAKMDHGYLRPLESESKQVSWYG